MIVPQAAAIARTPPQLADDAPHLLLVDDDRRIRDLLSRFLAGEGYRVTTAMSAKDRRERLLFATAKGEALVAKLAGLQTDRINGALGELDAAGADTVRRFLRAMIDRDDPDKVLEAIFGTGSATAKE